MCRAVAPVPMPSVSALVLTLTSTPLSRASSQNSRSPLCAPWNSWDSSSPSTTPRFFRVRCFLFGFPLPLAFCSGGVGRYGINCSSSFRRSICTRRDSGSKTPREVNFRPSSPKREGNFGFGLVTAAAAATTEAVLPPALGFEDEDDVEAPVVASPTGAGVAAVVPPFCCCCGPAPSAPSAPSAAASPLPLLLLLLLLWFVLLLSSSSFELRKLKLSSLISTKTTQRKNPPVETMYVK
mmetsp:Transcript_19241/g.41407  ORF Transcript_19241/g.41407 Transcript_19241/m.41407 type:complete len:238 (+) Transcript_19241:947-1660(+)